MAAGHTVLACQECVSLCGGPKPWRPATLAGHRSAHPTPPLPRTRCSSGRAKQPGRTAAVREPSKRSWPHQTRAGFWRGPQHCRRGLRPAPLEVHLRLRAHRLPCRGGCLQKPPEGEGTYPSIADEPASQQCAVRRPSSSRPQGLTTAPAVPCACPRGAGLAPPAPPQVACACGAQ